eukprot:TRINITY_DN14737_c0_g2_i1.p2 TRINITY_DN14737_c0_g2~~TRINITY_DN14737_c0_g2_i1.p2  ORF type:complete len:120 (+),score=29.62 TRINITY_DN14737_c0_g2_i1:74-433(+)
MEVLLGAVGAIAFVVLFIALVRAWRWYSRWARKQKRLDDINSEYELLRSVRQDALYHHGWAGSRGDHKEAEAHERHVMDIDEKLAKLKELYQSVEADRLDDMDLVSVGDLYMNRSSKDK